MLSMYCMCCLFIKRISMLYKYSYNFQDRLFVLMTLSYACYRVSNLLIHSGSKIVEFLEKTEVTNQRKSAIYNI